MTLHQDRVLAQLRALEEGRDRALRRFSELGSERPALNKPRPEAALAAQFRGDAGSDVAVADVEAGLAEYEAELARIDRESDAAHAAMLGADSTRARSCRSAGRGLPRGRGRVAQGARCLASAHWGKPTPGGAGLPLALAGPGRRRAGRAERPSSTPAARAHPRTPPRGGRPCHVTSRGQRICRGIARIGFSSRRKTHGQTSPCAPSTRPAATSVPRRSLTS